MNLMVSRRFINVLLLLAAIFAFAEGLICYMCSGLNSECRPEDNGGVPTKCTEPEPESEAICRFATIEEGNETTYFRQCSHVIAGMDKIVSLCQVDDIEGGRQEMLCFCKHDLCNKDKLSCMERNKVCFDDGDMVEPEPEAKKRHAHEPHNHSKNKAKSE